MNTFGALVLAVSVGVTLAAFEETCAAIDSRLPCSIPELYSTASHGAAFGKFAGSNNAEQIKDFFASSDGCPGFQSLYEASPKFQSFISDYMNAHASTFPFEHDELVAMALAAGIAPEYAFIENACAELGLMFGDVDVTSDPKLVNPPPIYTTLSYANSATSAKANVSRRSHSDHCSDVGLIYSTGDSSAVVQGHNEDWWSTVADKMSIIHTPDWWGYIYPGQLPGTSMAVNRHGLSFTMNSLYPLTPGYSADSVPNQKGVSYVFAYVLRSIMNSTTSGEVVERLNRYPIYSGYSLNVMSACDMSITNIEGYGDRIAVQSRHGASQTGTIFHFNRYLNSQVDQDDGQGTSTSRLECAQKSTFANGGDVRNFLGNLTCPVFFTESNGLGESETLASWVIDPAARQASMYRLPADCDETLSRCYVPTVSAAAPTVSGGNTPKVISWDYKCPATTTA